MCDKMITWFSVEFVTPQYRDQTCLVWFKDKHVPFIGWYDTLRCNWVTQRKGFFRTNKVTHWCMLNKPEGD